MSIGRHAAAHGHGSWPERDPERRGCAGSASCSWPCWPPPAWCSPAGSSVAATTAGVVVERVAVVERPAPRGEPSGLRGGPDAPG
jgi:hypothetical protein